MNIHITLVCYALDITSLVESLDGPDVTWTFFMHSERPTMVDSVTAAVGKLGDRWSIASSRNGGLARSWNEGLLQGQSFDVNMIANDDIRATREDLLLIAKGAVFYRACGVVQGMGIDLRMGREQEMAYALAAINPILIENGLLFDENLFPVNFEDSDLGYRCGLAGVPFHTVTDTHIVHTGTATVHSVSELMAQHRHTFELNRQYYVRKWGSEPGHEIFTRPFNDPRYDHRIDPIVRHAPYPGYNRDDQEIVKL